MKETPWPVRTVPTIRLAGSYAMGPTASGLACLDPTAAVHIHSLTGDLRIGRNQFQLASGDLTITPAYVPSHYRFETSGTHLVVHFWAKKPWRGCCRLPLHLRLGANLAAAQSKMLRVIDLHHQALTAGPTLELFRASASVALQDFLLWLSLLVRRKEEPSVQGRRSHYGAILTMQEIEQRYAEPLSTHELAIKAGLHPDYLARKFFQRYGYTIAHAIALRRLTAAKQLLQKSSMSIKEVANRCGIPDLQNFNKFFHKHLGMSPTRFRTITHPAFAEG